MKNLSKYTIALVHKRNRFEFEVWLHSSLTYDKKELLETFGSLKSAYKYADRLNKEHHPF